MKKQMFFRSNKWKYFVIVFALVFVVCIAIQSCEKQNTTTAVKQSTSDAATAIITKQQALARLNEYFKNEFSVIKMKQVSGVNKTQFTQWLRNGQMAATENMYLNPVLSSGGNEYVILKNVLIKETGQYASVGLIATTPNNYNKFTRMVAVINYNNQVDQFKHICGWMKCDSYEPCPCIFWLDVVSGPCPTDKCIVNEDCAHFSASDCNGELSGTTIHDILETLNS